MTCPRCRHHRFDVLDGMDLPEIDARLRRGVLRFCVHCGRRAGRREGFDERDLAGPPIGGGGDVDVLKGMELLVAEGLVTILYADGTARLATNPQLTAHLFEDRASHVALDLEALKAVMWRRPESWSRAVLPAVRWLASAAGEG